MPSTLTDGFERPALGLAVSLVSTAKIAAPLGSPIKRTPLGPNARGPADRSSTFPRCSAFGVSAAAAATVIAPRTIPAKAHLNCIERAFLNGGQLRSAASLINTPTGAVRQSCGDQRAITGVVRARGAMTRSRAPERHSAKSVGMQIRLNAFRETNWANSSGRDPTRAATYIFRT